MAKPKVAQGDTPYSVTVETSDEPTGKVAQQPETVTYNYDNGNKPNGKAKPAQEPTVSVFDSSVGEADTKAVDPADVEDKSVGRSERKSTRARR